MFPIPSGAPKLSNGRRSSGSTRPSKVSLANRGHVDHFDGGLTGIPGAEAVIASIRERRQVTKLALGHNALGDVGCVRLFAYLRSDDGRARDRITEISLNSNNVGEAGLLAIAAWLDGNTACADLFLQDNKFVLSETSAMTFADALNRSRLHGLSLNTNPTLGDAFVATFLSRLSAPHLRELGLSDINLTPRAAHALAAFVRARARCRLRTLKLNANALGIGGARKLVRALRANWSWGRVEMAANRLADGAVADDGDALSSSESEVDLGLLAAGAPQTRTAHGGASETEKTRAGQGRSRDWKGLEHDLHFLQTRNDVMRRQVEREALALLHHSRPALLRSWWQDRAPSANAASTEAPPPSTNGPRDPPAPPTSPPPIAPPHGPPPLPTELVHHILSFFAPALSPRQRLRILAFAHARATLPSTALLLPGARRDGGSSGCVPDPAAAGPVWSVASPPAGRRHDACADGCIGGVKCRREEERARWLAGMRCDAYDPYDEL